MKILGIDLGTTRSKTAASLLETDSAEIKRTSVPTSATELMDMFRRWTPDLIVMEATANVGWVVDLCRAMGLRFIVAKTTDEAWRNRSTKTDRRDADLLARLGACNQIRAVHIPEQDVREWRSFIKFRIRLVQARTRIKSHIKSILRQRDMPTSGLWCERGLCSLRLLAKPPQACEPSELWRAQLWMELRRLHEAEQSLAEAERTLNARGKSDVGVKTLTEIDGVGPRLAETVVAFLDHPTRFRNRREVGAYAGLAPRIRQSCSETRMGGISKTGSPELRRLLVEVVWLGIRREGWMQETFVRLCRDDPQRRNRAVVAIARRLLIRCWAKLRDLHRPPLSSVKAA